MTRRHRRKRMAEINVVPYIDVMLVLLVIFMITAPMLNQGVEVDLPQAEAKPISEQSVPPLVVTIDAAGGYHVEHGTRVSRDLDGDELGTRVAAVLQMESGTPIYIKGDREVPYGRVVFAMSLLQKAGAPTVGMLTEPVE